MLKHTKKLIKLTTNIINKSYIYINSDAEQYEYYSINIYTHIHLIL